MSLLIATHGGTFHADEVFAVAVLATVHPDHRILRTRRPEEIARADFVVDVGGVWEASAGRFDHHQRGFEGARVGVDAQGEPTRGTGYASAGLVWREYGSACVRMVAQGLGHTVDDGTAESIAEDVDAALVRYLDLVDTGAAEVAPGVFGLSSQIALLNSTWLEEAGQDPAAIARMQLERFQDGMAIVQRLLRRFVLRSIGQVLAADKVRGAERLLEGRLLYLADGGMPWTRVVIEEMPEVLLVLAPDAESGRFQLRTVPVTPGSFRSRMDLPQAWAGLRDEQLATVTGVPDAAFCHLNLFIAVARSLEGALRLAELALEARGMRAGADAGPGA